jgi:NAD(P)-dependent dehydrogenase (short-subunit alcohol dehydrogenase family)
MSIGFECAPRSSWQGVIARGIPNCNRKHIRQLHDTPAAINFVFEIRISILQFRADLSVQREVRELAAAIRNRCARVDVLINNAGARFESFRMTGLDDPLGTG